MAVIAADIVSYKSTTEGDTMACGGAIDTGTVISSGTDNNLFGAITGAEAASGVTKYRKMFRKNTNGADTWYAVKAWISLQPTTGALSVALGVNHADDTRANMSELTAWSAAAKVSLTSSGSDTRNVVIYGEVAGVYTAETVALTSTSEVLSTNTFDLGRVFMIVPATTDTTTVTIKQGTGGTTRGAIASGGKVCTYFRTGADIDTKLEGFSHGDIATTGVAGYWLKLIIPASSIVATAVPMKVKTEGSA
jgi:hypothetical protein